MPPAYGGMAFYWSKVADWRIYYGNDDTFSSDDGEWSDAPAENVQVVVTYQAHPYKVLTDGIDEYRLDGLSESKRGQWIDTDQFYSIQQRAMQSTRDEP